MANPVQEYRRKKEIEKLYKGNKLSPVKSGREARSAVPAAKNPMEMLAEQLASIGATPGSVPGDPRIMDPAQVGGVQIDWSGVGNALGDFFSADPSVEGGWEGAVERAGLPSWWPEGIMGIPKAIFGKGEKPEATPAAAAPPAISFGTSVGSGGASVPAPASDIGAIVLAAIPGAQITSAVRSDADNERVRGVPNSFHLAANGGSARDFIPPKGMNMADFHRKIVSSLPPGWEAINEGNHVHVEPAPSAVGTATPTVGLGATSIPINYLDPSFAMSVIPAARTVGRVDLPDAPQQDMPAALPMFEAPDKEALLAELRSVIMPETRDTSKDPWDRFSALLAGAAEGAAMAGPYAGLGEMIGMAGARGARSFHAERKEQDAETKKQSEAIRQAQVALAKAGLDLDLSALTVRNQNKDREWQSGENTRQTKFTNAEAAWNANVREVMANLGIDQFNAGTLNSRDLVRAQAGLNAAGGAVAAQNTANTIAASGGAAGGPAAQQDRIVSTMLSGLGIDLANTKDPRVTTARSTAAAIAANNVDGALQSFAQELVINGAAEQILAPVKGEKGPVAEAKAQAYAEWRRIKNSGKAPKPEQLAAITSTIASLLSSNHQVALQIAQDYAKMGLPSASLITQYNKSK